ncbi:MAG: hypothetical protein K0S76_1929 [Herbinix sp.]|jgi:hypothetical protein|nr:hypothetical protein [Herbinix sp.]
MEKIDFKKKEKDIYNPKNEPTVILIPPMKFIMVDGKGNPNDTDGEYPSAVELIYTFSYAIKMSPRNGFTPEGYYDYVVPPLEGLWWLTGDEYYHISKKDQFCWTSMLRQPEFVTDEVFYWALEVTKKKKPQLDLSKARLETFNEGLCVQIMHHGPYDNEPATVEKVDNYIKEQGYANDISTVLPDGKIRRHHEIYLSDPSKAKPENMKTIIRHPVRRAFP